MFDYVAMVTNSPDFLLVCVLTMLIGHRLFYQLDRDTSDLIYYKLRAHVFWSDLIRIVLVDKFTVYGAQHLVNYIVFVLSIL